MRGRLDCQITRLVRPSFFHNKPFFVQMMRMEEKGEVSHSVDCGNGHFFCWECLGEAHAPVACHKYQAVRSQNKTWLTGNTDPGVSVQVCEDRPRGTAILLSKGIKNEMIYF